MHLQCLIIPIAPFRVWDLNPSHSMCNAWPQAETKNVCIYALNFEHLCGYYYVFITENKIMHNWILIIWIPNVELSGAWSIVWWGTISNQWIQFRTTLWTVLTYFSVFFISNTSMSFSNIYYYHLLMRPAVHRVSMFHFLVVTAEATMPSFFQAYLAVKFFPYCLQKG